MALPCPSRAYPDNKPRGLARQRDPDDWKLRSPWKVHGTNDNKETFRYTNEATGDLVINRVPRYGQKLLQTAQVFKDIANGPLTGSVAMNMTLQQLWDNQNGADKLRAGGSHPGSSNDTLAPTATNPIAMWRDFGPRLCAEGNPMGDRCNRCNCPGIIYRDSSEWADVFDQFPPRTNEVITAEGPHYPEAHNTSAFAPQAPVIRASVGTPYKTEARQTEPTDKETTGTDHARPPRYNAPPSFIPQRSISGESPRGTEDAPPRAKADGCFPIATLFRTALGHPGGNVNRVRAAYQDWTLEDKYKDICFTIEQGESIRITWIEPLPSPMAWNPTVYWALGEHTSDDATHQAHETREKPQLQLLQTEKIDPNRMIDYMVYITSTADAIVSLRLVMETEDLDDYPRIVLDIVHRAIFCERTAGRRALPEGPSPEADTGFGEGTHDNHQ
ncbi:unnamed protein product [Prorocentrum cordatum]|uniref:Uncharacterized protein n=1 Tax=Prorocentrum cordatum TaxID=2364126 RepID=A0ABN9QDR9_9DINO|nr:unnamed protein product [Polarella glacialis]